MFFFFFSSEELSPGARMATCAPQSLLVCEDKLVPLGPLWGATSSAHTSPFVTRVKEHCPSAAGTVLFSIVLPLAPPALSALSRSLPPSRPAYQDLSVCPDLLAPHWVQQYVCLTTASLGQVWEQVWGYS